MTEPGQDPKSKPETGENKTLKPADATAKPQDQAKPRLATTDENAVALLKADHRKVEGLFAEFETADEERQREIIHEACQDLVIHTLIEERLFYPAARQPATEDKLNEAQVEHDAAKMLILELQRDGDRDPYRNARFKVLAEEIKHHVKEEEAPDGLFAKAQKAGINTPDLAEALNRLKQQLQQKAQSGMLPDPDPASFHQFGGPSNQERNMPIERDDRGRFMSDDDHRSRSRGDYDDDRRYPSRGSYGRERDSQGRFMSDDDDDRGYRSRGPTGRDRDSQGRFMSDDDRGRSYGARSRDDDDDRRHRSRSRDDDRDYRGARDHGQGGWFGDSEGHAEASRQGWDNPDHGRSGWYGDSRSHAEASRRGWDNPDHGPSGWYGDSEGHSEASRRGWDERGRERGSYSSSRSEPRSYRSRDDDDDRGYRSSGRSRSGWSGDPEGHSEAARRGWEHRR